MRPLDDLNDCWDYFKLHWTFKVSIIHAYVVFWTFGVENTHYNSLHIRAAMIGYGSAGALIFSLYIIYDTQLMMGGKHKYSLDPEEYIFAALNIYLDVINLFMYILMIVGGSSDD